MTRSTFGFWLRCILFSIGACTPLLATILTTNLSGLALEIAVGVRAYASDHDGTPPRSWDNLRGYLDFENMDHRYKMPVRSTMMMLGDIHPALEGPSSEKIVAMAVFAIDEDRREEIGRYVVIQRSDGTFSMRWANESAIQKACAAESVRLPPTAVFQEVPLRIHSLEYKQRRMWLWFGSVAALIIAGAIFWRARSKALAKHRFPGPAQLPESEDDIVIKW